MAEHHYFVSIVGPNKPLMQCREEEVRSVRNRESVHGDINVTFYDSFLVLY